MAAIVIVSDAAADDEDELRPDVLGRLATLSATAPPFARAGEDDSGCEHDGHTLDEDSCIVESALAFELDELGALVGGVAAAPGAEVEASPCGGWH